MKNVVLTLILLASSGMLLLKGQADEWQKTKGPYGTSWIYDIEIDPRNSEHMYIGTNRGVYMSVNLGQSWQEIISSDFVNEHVISIAINPDNPQIILLITNNEIYRTVNKGIDWVKLADKLPDSGGFKYLKYSQNQSNTLYLAGVSFDWIQETDTDLVLPRLWRSSDNGESWELVFSSTNQKFQIESFTVSPHDSARIYLGTSPRDTSNTGGPGVLISKDYGESWDTFVKDGLLSGRIVLTVEVDPINPDIVYVGTSVNDDPFGPGSLCIKTTDHGANWMEILNRNLGGMERVRRIHIHPVHNDTIYICGDRLFFRSNNGGLSYDGKIHSSNYFTARVFPPNEGDHEIIFEDPPIVYSGGYGFYESKDGGRNFTLKNTGIESEKSRCIKIDPYDPDNVYTITYTGYGNQYTYDGGQSWQIPESSVLNNYGMLLEVSQSNPENIYATCTSGLWKSTDRGKTWSWINSQFQNSHVHGLAVHPFDENIIYVGVGRDWSNPSGQGLYKTTDGGDSWHNINEGFPDDVHVAEIKIDPINPEVVYIATRGHQEGGSFDMSVSEGRGVYKSINGGGSWFPINNGIENKSISSVVVNPRNPDIIYASATSEHMLQHLNIQGTVYKSIDAGESWTEVNNGLEWPEGMDISLNIHSLVICPKDPDIVYATAMSSDLNRYQGSVFKTENGGERWFLLNEGLKRAGSDDFQAVEYIDLDPTGDIVYCAINSGVVHKIDNSPDVDNIPPVIIAGPALFDNTPFSVTIKWNTHEAGTSIMEYGLTTDYGQTLSTDSLEYYHSLKLDDLEKNKTYHFRVGSVDGLGNGPRWSEDFTLALADDKKAPEITKLSELDDTNQMGSFPISCQVVDLYGIKKVTMLYKTEYADEFQEVVMEQIEGDQFLATIPKQSAGGYIDYYIFAEDSSSNVALHPSSAPYGTYGFKIYETEHRDLSYLYLSQFDGSPVSRINLSTMEEEDLVFNGAPIDGWRGNLSKSSNDSLIARTVYNMVGIFDAESGLLIDTMYTPVCDPTSPNCLGKSVFSNDHQKLYAVKYCNEVPDRISIFDVPSFSYESDIILDQLKSINDIEISEDNGELFISQTDGSEGVIIIIDLSTNKIKKTINLGLVANVLSLSNDYKHLHCFNSVYIFPSSTSYISKIDLDSYEVVDSMGIATAGIGEQFDIVENRKGNSLLALVDGDQFVLADLDSYIVQWGKKMPVVDNGWCGKILSHPADRNFYFPRFDDGVGHIHRYDIVADEFSILKSHTNIGGAELVTLKKKIHAPGDFDLLSPGAGDTVNLPDVILSWERAIDPDADDMVKYEVIYSLDPNFNDSTVIPDITQESHTLSHHLESGGRLWWKVVARDQFGLSSTSSQVYYFDYVFNEAINYPPNPFELHIPPNDAVISTSEVNLIWEAAIDINPEDLVVYNLYYSTRPDFSDQTAIHELQDTSYKVQACFTSATEIWWKVEAVDSYGNKRSCNEVYHFLVNECDPNSINFFPEETTSFIAQNFPNPVEGITSIRFGVEELGEVKLKLFDIYGRELITFLNKRYAPGIYEIAIDLSCYSSGYYIYKIQMNDFEDSRMLFRQ